MHVFDEKGFVVDQLFNNISHLWNNLAEREGGECGLVLHL